MPPLKLVGRLALPPYPESLTKQLNLTLFPLDLTLTHEITRGEFRRRISPFIASGSPLAEWVSTLLAHCFCQVDSMHPGYDGDKASLSLHDPVCVWYAITKHFPQWTLSAKSPEDIRIETTGQWTRGMCVIDRRNRKRHDDDVVRSNDHGRWLSNRAGNRINRMVTSPGSGVFVDFLLRRLFG
jgi:inosine-uridine nucleoside N-ribohydrolase